MHGENKLEYLDITWFDIEVIVYEFTDVTSMHIPYAVNM